MDGQTVSNMDTSMNTSLNTSVNTSLSLQSLQLGNKCTRVFVNGQNKQGGRYTVKELHEHE